MVLKNKIAVSYQNGWVIKRIQKSLFRFKMTGIN